MAALRATSIFVIWFRILSFHGFSREGFGELICPPNIQRFSSSGSPAEYYECTGSLTAPIRKSCQANQVYFPRKEICVNITTKATQPHREKRSAGGITGELKNMDELTLGRLVHLGCLFDARTNTIFPATSFWAPKTISENKMRTPLKSMKTTFFAAKTAYERLAKMDINAEIKLDFLGGLISVSGGAKYLRESAEKTDEVSFNLAFDATTHSETLPTGLPKDYTDLCGLEGPTHVVSSVIYGMGANFVFKRDLRNDESKEEIGGYLQAVVKAIPLFSIEGKASIDISGSQKTVAETTDVKLYGDFILQSQPTTYEAAVEVYRKLPELLGEDPDYKGASILKMYLTPITMYCGKTDAILMSISENLVNEVSVQLDNMDKLQGQVSSLIDTKPARLFQPVRRNLDNFETSLRTYKTKFQSKLQSILPKIRGAGSGEEELTELLVDYNQSPFNFEKSSMFLGRRRREINAIDIVLTSMKDIVKVADYEQADDVFLLINTPTVVISELFVLQPDSVTDGFLSRDEVPETDFWFNKPDQVSKVGSILKTFKEFVVENALDKNHGFLVKVMPVKQDESVLTTAREQGKELEDFTLPDVPEDMQVEERMHDSVAFRIRRPENIHVTSYEIRYWDYVAGEASGSISKVFPFSVEPGATQLVRVDNLKPATMYNFKLKHVTRFGRSPPSEETGPIITTPSSEPTGLRIVTVSETDVSVAWEQPAVIGEGITISDYMVTLYSADPFQSDGVTLRTAQTNSRQVSFKDLQAARFYTISIKAILPRLVYNTSLGTIQARPESLVSNISVTTSPEPPSAPSVQQVDHHDASLYWSPPERIAQHSKITEYQVKYTKMNDKGDEEIIGSTLTQKTAVPKIKLADIAQGNTYRAQVQVKTTAGTSTYSSATIFKTLYVKSELEMFREGLGLKELDQRIRKNGQQIEESKREISGHEKQLSLNRKDINGNIQTIGNDHRSIGVNSQRISEVRSRKAWTYVRRDGGCYGHDIRYIPNTSVSRCMSACIDTSDCQSFTYTSNDRYCYLKHYACQDRELGHRDGRTHTDYVKYKVYT